MIIVLSMILTFIITISAKPLQEWIHYRLNKKAKEQEKRDAIIEEAFSLTQDLEKWIHDLNSVIFAAYLLKNNVSRPDMQTNSGEIPKEKDLNRLKYILIYEIPVSNRIIEKLDRLKDDINFGIRVATRGIMKPLFDTTFPEDAVIEKDYDGDAIRAASTLAGEISKRLSQLVQEIQKFLESEKLGKNNVVVKGNNPEEKK